MIEMPRLFDMFWFLNEDLFCCPPRMLVGHLFVNRFTLDPDERISGVARTPSSWGVMEEPNQTNLIWPTSDPFIPSMA